MRLTRTVFGPFLFPALVTALLLAGCAEKGPILLAIGYLPPEGKVETSKKIVAGVSPFKDSRGVPASVLGKRTTSSGLENDLVVQGAVAELVTAKLKEALTARGIAVKDVSGWDRTTDNMPANGFDVLLGGEIKSLWLDSTSVPFKTTLKASIQIKIVAGDSAEKKVIRTLDVSSGFEQEILYSREKLERALSEALSSALDQIFRDDVLSKKLGQ